MKFKSPELEAELEASSIFLQLMAKDFDRLLGVITGHEAVITRVLEKVKGSSGVHEDNRAFDVRSESGGVTLFSDTEIKKIVDSMNELFPRNDGKPTCYYHSFQGGPFHFHVQLATLTKAYEPVAR